MGIIYLLPQSLFHADFIALREVCLVRVFGVMQAVFYCWVNNHIIPKGKYDKGGMIVDVENEIAEISTYVPTYKYLVGCPGSRNPVADGFEFGWFMHSQCKNLDMASAIFVIIDSNLVAEEKQRMIRLLESYVMRRAVCGLTDKSFNKG